MHPDNLAEAIRRIELRLDALEEQMRESRSAAAAHRLEVAANAGGEPVHTDGIFDLALIGRTLIVFGGAYLLRAITEGGMVPAAIGVLLGLLYAVSWSIFALRPSVSRLSAAHHGIATTFTSLPLLFEAARRFRVFDGWSSALALLVVSAVVITMVWRRGLHGIAWTFTLSALAAVPLLMAVTNSIVPFTLYLTAIGIATLWAGYVLDWYLLRWVVAAEVDLVLVLLAFLIVTGRLTTVPPAAAIIVACAAFGAYLGSFAIRTIVREREVVLFEIAQTLALLITAIGSAMWIAANKSTFELSLALAMLALAAASYAVAFAFIPRHSLSPSNFVFYSSLALMLSAGGGGFLTRGIWSSVFWSALAVTCGWLSAKYQKPVLTIHAAVYLFAGFLAGGIMELGFRAMFLNVDGWQLAPPGAVFLLIAAVITAAIHPRIVLLSELTWITATLAMTSVGVLFLDGAPAAAIAVTRTALLAALIVGLAAASRTQRLSEARSLCDGLMAILIMKLVWEDFRVGSPATLFASLAIVGLALILTSQLRRSPLPVIS